jgi:nucleoside-diphosphate-sugar epimerase
VARILIVGCGCRGRALARDLRAEGHAVRGTTRDPAHAAEIEAVDAQAHVCDPDQLGTLLPALDGVTIVCWLLASATGEAAAALHGTRLERLFEEIVDTPVRGVVYEAAGSLPEDLLAGGVAIARDAQERWRIPVALLEADPGDPANWGKTALSAVGSLLRR